MNVSLHFRCIYKVLSDKPQDVIEFLNLYLTPCKTKMQIFGLYYHHVNYRRLLNEIEIVDSAKHLIHSLLTRFAELIEEFVDQLT